jgi:glutamyl-tRNA synthetase
MAEKLFSLDRDGAARPRKDIAHASEVKELFGYMFDEYFDKQTSLNFDEKQTKENIKKLISEYISVYDENDDKQAWFEKLKTVADKVGYVDMKTYKADPEAYIGNIADASNIVRVAVTGRTNTPDLCSLMQMLGRERVLERLNFVVSNI